MTRQRLTRYATLAAAAAFCAVAFFEIANWAYGVSYAALSAWVRP